MQQQLKNVVFYAAVTYITQQALHYLVFHNALVQLLVRWSAERALDALDLMIDYGGVVMSLCCSDLTMPTPYDIPIGDFHERLADNPRFRHAKSRMRALVELQRTNIRSLLALHDMDRLLAPLITPTDALSEAAVMR